MKRYILSILLILLGFTALAQSHKIDSLRKALAGEKEDTNKSKTLNSLAGALFSAGEYDSTLFYANRAKALAERIGFERGLAAIYCNLANATSYKGNNAMGIEYASKALEISKKYNIARLTAFAYNILGYTYMGVENYPKAINAFSEGISVCTKNGDKRNLFACLANLSIIYDKENDAAKALTYDTMALATAMEIGNSTGVYNLQNNTGELYFRLGNFKKAKEYYALSFDAAKKMGDKLVMFSYYSNMGEIYIHEGNYPKALDSKNKALSLVRETGKKNDITKAYCEVGQMYNTLKKYTLAKAYLDSSLSISKAIGEVEISRDGYHTLYLTDSANGDIKAELEDYKKYLFYRDSLANELSDKKMAQAEMNYIFARKMDSAQAAQDKLNVIAENEKGRQKVIEYALGGGLTLAFVASGIFFFQRRRIAKERQKLKESNEVKDKLFSIISHDLRSPLNLLNGMLGLFRRGKITPENSEVLSQNLEGSMQSTMNLLDNLLSWSHSQMKGFNIKPEKLNLAEVANDVLTLYSNAARQKGILLEADLPAGIELEADKNVIKLVMRNLLNNAIKFSNQGGKVRITAFRENSSAGFSVKDNGIGIPSAILSTLLELGDTQKNREGTNGEQGSGLGLVLCDELVKRSGGELKVESEEGNGTIISVYFPA